MSLTIQLFENQHIRTAWDEEKEEWYFSIVDVVGVLTDSVDPTAYWRKLKQRLKAEGNETVTNCHGLKMTAHDGKKRLTDVADTEQLLRIIQSIPSPKAEPFKLWLAQVGRKPPPRKFPSRRHRRPFRRTSTWPVPVARWLATHERPLRRRPAFPSSLPRTPHSSAKWLQIYWKMRGIKKMGRFKICLAIDKEHRVLTARSAHGFSFGFLQPLLEFR